MSIKRAIQVYPTLKKLANAKQGAQRKKILSDCPCQVYKVLGDIPRNVLKGKIKVPSKNLKRLKLYKKQMRVLAKSKSKAGVKRISNQKGGALLPFLLKPALSLLATIVANKIAK